MRKETDLLGTLNLGNKVYYGIHTQRAINNFKISKHKLSQYPQCIAAMLILKKACASANVDLGELTPQKGQIIIKACDHILNNVDQFSPHFPIDMFQGGAGTSVNMNVNEVIANVALELSGNPKGTYSFLHPNDHVNKCQSTNDVYPSGMRIALYRHVEPLLKSAKHLIDALNRKKVAFKDFLKTGRTQLQDAVPMSLGSEFGAWADALEEGTKHIRDGHTLLLRLNMGGTAIGTGINAAPEFGKVTVAYINKYTGHSFSLAKNLIQATSDCGDFVTVSSGIKRFSVALSKLCNDLRLLSSGPRCGFNDIQLPQLQAGSSIMPGKVNPIIPEVVNQVCYKVFGNDLTVTHAAEASQLQLNAMEPVMFQSLFESIALLDNACRSLADKCIEGIHANREALENSALNSTSLVTYLTPYLGHEACEQIAKEAQKTGKSIQEILSENEASLDLNVKDLFNAKNLLSHGRERRYSKNKLKS